MSSGAVNLTNTLGQNFDIKGLNFLAMDAGSNTIGAISIGGANTLQIEGDALTNSNTVGVTLGMTTLVPNVTQTWTNSPAAGPLTINSAVTGPAAAGTTTLTLADNSSNPMSFNGIIGNGSGGSLALTINGSGTGSVVLSAANIFTGPTTLTAGTLDVKNQLALQDSVLTLNGGTIAFDSAVTGNAFTVGGLSGSANLALQNTSSAAIALSVGGGNNTATYSGSLSLGGSIIKVGTGTQTLSGTNSYTGTTSASNGELILSGTNTSTATISATNAIVAGTTVLSIRNANALGAGSANSSLAPITLNATGTDLSAFDSGSRRDDRHRSRQFHFPKPHRRLLLSGGRASNGIQGLLLPRTWWPTDGQINLGFLGNSDDGTGFAAYNAGSLSSPRIVALYTPTVGSTTLAIFQEKFQFGQGTGDHLTLGSPTANNTVIIENEIDIYGGPSRRWASIRGVGNTPEGEYLGAIINTNAETAATISISTATAA